MGSTTPMIPATRPPSTRNTTVSPLPRSADALRGNGETVVFLVEGGRVAGIIGVVDPIKPYTLEALQSLAAEGIRVVMLTGDDSITAQAVVKKLGIAEMRAEVLPREKGA